MSKGNAVVKKSETILPDGRWFCLKRATFAEATLSEVEIKDGKVISAETNEDLSKICLGKLLRRISETYGDGDA